jgi:hypothetical protein
MWRDAMRKGLIEKYYENASPTMYHYTTPDGLLGIVESGELWMSDYSYLNDAQELIYGLELAGRRFAAAATGAPRASRILRKWGNIAKTLSVARVCIASFSFDSDSLSQWRAYGPIAIGFKFSPLMFGYANTVVTRSVIYEPDVQRGLLDLMAHYCASAYLEDQKTLASDKLESLYEDGTDRLLDVTAFLKHPAFAVEHELRMVHVENSRVFASLQVPRAPHRFRSVGQVIVPYVTTRDVAQLDYPDKLSIDEIVIGPFRHAEVLERGVKELLSARGYGSIRVRRSAAPLRA